MVVVVTGVAGAGKSTIGRRLADELGCSFYDADDFHSARSVRRMGEGIALTDADREEWLTALEVLVQSLCERAELAVLACSALRAAHRARLQRAGEAGDGVLGFVFLRIDPALAHARIERRVGHFMPASLVASQFSALEAPDDVLVVDADLPPAEIVARIRAAYSL
jgi:gluconokinase